MEALGKHHDPHMGFYFPCSHCKQKYVSVACIQEHSLRCYMQASFLNPKIRSNSNPQASEPFQFRPEIIKKEPDDDNAEDHHTDWKDETEESTTLRSPVEICQNVPIHKEMELETIRPEPEIFGVSKDLDSIQNPNSTSKGAQHQHEDCHILEPNYLCDTCGKCFASGTSFVHHVKSHHQPAPVFHCCFPGCVETFKSTVARWHHHKTHPSGAWNEGEWRPRMLKKNQAPMTAQATTTMARSCEYLFLDNQDIKHQPMADNIGESSMTDQDAKYSEHSLATSSTDDMKSQDLAQVLSCSYPGCSRPFSSKFELWNHQKAHPAAGLWNDTEEIPGMIGPNRMSEDEDAASTIVPVIDNGGTQNQLMGQPFIGRRLVALKITGQRKVNLKELIPNAVTARPNTPQGSAKGELSPGKTLLFTCGICEDSFENFGTVIFHMLTTHPRPEQSQAKVSEEIGTPLDNSFGSVQFSCRGDQVPVEVKAETQATLNLPEPEKKFKGRKMQRGPLLRYPIVTIGDKKYFYCGFPGCDAVFNNRHARYKHHKKVHGDTYRSMLTNLAVQRLSQKKANETSSSTQFEGNSEEVQKTEPYVELCSY